MSVLRSVSRDERGYTLVELLFVVAIIGILIVIVLGTYHASTALAQKVSCESNLRTIRQAVSLYRHATGANPGQLADLAPSYVSRNSLRCPTTRDTYNYEPSSGRVWCPVHDF